MPLRRKKFILALQPHEAHPYNGEGWSSKRKDALAFSMSLLVLMGLAFPMTPDLWASQIKTGLLRISYGWQSSPLMSQSEASAIYTDLAGKAPKTGCKDASERDWAVFCPILHTQGYTIDCANANKEGKAEILRNLENSKTTSQYACLYGN